MRQLSNGGAAGPDANAETLHTHSVQYNSLKAHSVHCSVQLSQIHTVFNTIISRQTWKTFFFYSFSCEKALRSP